MRNPKFVRIDEQQRDGRLYTVVCEQQMLVEIFDELWTS